MSHARPYPLAVIDRISDDECMSHFYGRILGRRGKESTRCGDKSSGLTAQANGWEVGGTVEIAHVDGQDIVRLYATRGSGRTDKRLVATVHVDPNTYELIVELAGSNV